MWWKCLLPSEKMTKLTEFHIIHVCPLLDIVSRQIKVAMKQEATADLFFNIVYITVKHMITVKHKCRVGTSLHLLLIGWRQMQAC